LTKSRNTYWAALPDSADVAREVLERRKTYRAWLESTGATRRGISGLRAYYGWGPQGLGDTSQLGQSGMTGEYTEMALPEFAGLVEQAFAQLTATKSAFMAVPKSSDFDAQASAKFAESLLEAYDRDNGIEDSEDEATLVGLLCREGWVAISWDKQGGSTIGLDGARVAYEGDVRADVCLPWDVVYDMDAGHKKDLRWIAWCRPVSRWDLIGMYAQTEAPIEPAAPVNDGTPEGVAAMQQYEAAMQAHGVAMEKYAADAENLKKLSEAIVAFDEPESEFTSVRDFLRGKAGTGMGARDLVPVWELRHLPTPGLPQGRLVQFLSPEAVLYDSAAAGVGYPYDSLCMRTFEPGKVVGTASGHTMAWDLLGMAEAVDMVATAMATAASASAFSNIWAPPGSNLTPKALADGLNLIESTVMPVPLKGIQVDPQAVGFLEACSGWMQKRMGLNDVAMGDPSKGMPAQLAALLDAKVVQFWSRAIKSLSFMRAGVRTDILGILKRFAKSPRMATLAGKNNSWALKEWSGDRLATVARVAVEPVSAVSKTLAGKLAMADALLERGLLKTPEEYLAVKSTGRLEKLTEWQDMNLLRIQREKEMLRAGVGLPPIDEFATDEALAIDPEALPVFVASGEPGQFIRPTIVDTPWLDIPEYAAVMASPDARDTPAVVEACSNMIQYKVQMWRVMPPEIIAALGGYPPPPDAMAMEPMPADASESPIPAEGGENADGMRRIVPPKPPPNPITGEQAPAASDVSQPV